MEFFSHKTQINFMQQKKLAFIFSIAIFIISLTTLYIKGLNLGLDFTGGSQIELHFDQSVQTSDIRKKLQPLALKEFTLQSYGTSQDVVLKIGFKITPEIKKKIQ